MDSKELTPLMQQYWTVKAAHPDKIVLFRMGDFFEMFHDDAKEAAPLLGIALTMRNRKSGDQTPMCGVPHHSIGSQINKLLAFGRKVAICDQVEDPKLAKGLVKREVTRVLTPGMVFDPDTLEGDKPLYLAAFEKGELAFLDSTTGEGFYYENLTLEQQRQLLGTLLPVEVVLSPDQMDFWQVLCPEELKPTISEFHGASQTQDRPAVRRLIGYAEAMLKTDRQDFFRNFEKRSADYRLEASAQVFRHLEVFTNYRGDKEGTLFSAINRTKTAGGARRLKHWLLFPLTDPQAIAFRHDEVAFWAQDLERLKSLRKELFLVGDFERRLGKLSQPQCHPRDMNSLKECLISAEKLMVNLRHLNEAGTIHKIVGELSQEIERALIEEPPNQHRDGGFIQKGYHPTLDEYIDTASHAQEKVRALEAAEREATGIQSLKIRYNNVFGYYIEVTNTHKSKVPNARYQRKQTLTNAERYVTDELNELEKKVISAKTKRTDLELQLFEELKSNILAHLAKLMKLADELNSLDAFTSLAWLAIEQSYVRPQMLTEGGFRLEGSRHPVIEQFLAKSFVANDILIEPEQCLLITGPNMAGKSTLMRQVAITSLMAQMGSFVPARSAELPILDKIFTRIGASDFLTEGLSTFMVEMKETAQMLAGATSRSLVVLDEVGRGTSTYDGMSLAQSVLEYFLRKLKSYTLFATHYHELTVLERRYPGKLINQHMSIVEKNQQIEFRYHLLPGPAQKSYGIQVARLAGLPPEVVQYAAKLLERLEQTGKTSGNSQQMDLWSAALPSKLESPPEEPHQLLKSIRSIEIQKLTPLEALNKLAQWQQELS